jgi:hypothetical protein
VVVSGVLGESSGHLELNFVVGYHCIHWGNVRSRETPGGWGPGGATGLHVPMICKMRKVKVQLWGVGVLL